MQPQLTPVCPYLFPASTLRAKRLILLTHALWDRPNTMHFKKPFGQALNSSLNCKTRSSELEWTSEDMKSGNS